MHLIEELQHFSTLLRFLLRCGRNQKVVEVITSSPFCVGRNPARFAPVCAFRRIEALPSGLPVCRR
ncbi:hypothetical protein KCP76_09665 [Salmonella enterica subsp. enterica serovar Weltevreden]|nr:hypothetical protein KCP76_09665 [Salmonella enterica subsp. enterica serovar Weltevreden]